MTHINRGDAEALATFVRRLRPHAGEPGHWNQAGTVTAIQQCKAPLSETAIALIRLAEDTTVRSPSLLNSDGHWWHRAAKGEQPSEAATRYRQVMCPEHPQHPLGTENCPECQKDAGDRLTPEQIAANAARIRQEIEDAARRTREQDAQLHARQETQP